MRPKPFADIPARLMRRAAFEYGKVRLEQDFARLMRDVESVGADAYGPRIGIATLGSGEWHLVLDLLLARSLAQRGAAPQLLLCDVPGLPICDERTVFSKHQSECDGCFAAKETLLNGSKLPWQGISRYLPAGIVSETAARVAELDADAIAAFSERGWPIGQWLHVSGCHFLRCDERGSTAEKIEARRRWLATAIVILHAAERWLDEIQPDIVMVQGGAHARWRIVRELAQARGIPVVSREMGKGGWDHHIYALNADCMTPNLDEEWSATRDIALSADENATVDDLLARLPAITYESTRAGAVTNRAVPSRSRTVVAFTNVTWDLATAGRDEAFGGVFDWVRETIRTLSGYPDVHLIVRAHPAEAVTSTRERILDQILSEWPSGVPGLTLIEPEAAVTAPELFAQADLVLAYNSTAGLEAAIHGRAVIVAGAPHYRDRGFTVDARSRAGYQELLRAWANGARVAAAPDASELARRYFHLFFARYTIAMGWTSSPLSPPYRLGIRSIDELKPGRNAALDAVCDGILQRRQVLLPRRLEEPTCVM